MRKSMSEISTPLALMGMVGVLGCLMWSPIFIATAIDQEELLKNGRQTIGEVVDHDVIRRNNRAVYTASIRYTVRNHAFLQSVQGSGAEASLLPLGTKVTVNFLAKKPDFSSVTVSNATSGTGLGWGVVFGMWGVAIALLGGAWLTRKPNTRSVVN
ncbi:DUF3592 domain-containing protein [Duganella sp. PWIR1]